MAEQELWSGDRRRFIRNSVLAISGLFLAGSGCNLIGAPVREPTLQEITAEIKKFETNIGSRPLTFEEAKGYIPLLATFFSKGTQSSRPPQYFVDRTFIIKYGYQDNQEEDRELDLLLKPNSDVFQNSVVKTLLNAYPNLDLSTATARRIAFNAASRPFFGKALGFVSEEQQVFLTLNTVPAESVTKGYFEGSDNRMIEMEIPVWQYSGLGISVDCQTPTAVADFRSVCLHEFTHLDEDQKKVALEQDVIDSYNNTDPDINLISDPEDRKRYSLGWATNFIAEFSTKDIVSGWPKINFLNEFSTDYLMVRLNTRAGLSYRPVYGMPYELANFAAILQQSEISDTNLHALKQSSSLREFLLKVGSSARNIELRDSQDALNFSVLRFLHFKPEGMDLYPSFFNWKQFEPYFSGIDTRIYQFVDPRRLTFPMFFGTKDGGKFYQAHVSLSCK